MTDQNKEALRLADALCRRGYATLTMNVRIVDPEIAAHLRRLVAENTALREAAREGLDVLRKIAAYRPLTFAECSDAEAIIGIAESSITKLKEAL